MEGCADDQKVPMQGEGKDRKDESRGLSSDPSCKISHQRGSGVSRVKEGGGPDEKG